MAAAFDSLLESLEPELESPEPASLAYSALVFGSKGIVPAGRYGEAHAPVKGVVTPGRYMGYEAVAVEIATPMKIAVQIQSQAVGLGPSDVSR